MAFTITDSTDRSITVHDDSNGTTRTISLDDLNKGKGLRPKEIKEAIGYVCFGEISEDFGVFPCRSSPIQS